MSKIIPVSITTTEQAVTLDATYQFVWLRNMGENDCLLSDHSGIVAGDDNVTLVKAGESGRITTSGRAVYIKTVDGTSTGEIHAQNFSDVPFKSKAKGGGQSISVEPLTVTDNGVYTAPTGKAYSPVNVDVQEQPWEPLEDGYSNFWFELTNDTLSPWLNFSAKNADAVIDWGDGSGEQPLDTLTPTHTYSKAGKYVVKVKGVTGIAAQNPVPNPAYTAVLKNVELNSDVLSISNQGFYRCGALENVVMQNSVTSIGAYVFQYSVLIKSVVLSSNISAIGAYFMCYDYSIKKITIPASVISIGSSAFNTCAGMSEVHIQATTPPSLGSYAFSNLASNYIIYVPVGYGDTYKAAWTDYADHILEEGQTPNRMMLAKFENTKRSDDEEMR